MSSLASVVAFASVSFIATAHERRRRTRDGSDDGGGASSSSSPPALTKERVEQLRASHFLGNVSVSYANSGPLMIMGGTGSRLVDEAGASYLDTRNNVAHVGHGNPAVVDAVQRQVSTLNTNTRYLHPNAVELARRLSEKLPEELCKVVFVNSGSEANDLALRLARAKTGSSNTIVVDRAYHGHTLSVLEVSPYKYEHSGEFSLTQQGSSAYHTPGRHVYKVPCPDAYRGRHRGDPDRYAEYVEEACEHYESGGESVGAFVVEGGMSVAGVVLPPPGYLRRCAAAVRASGGVYIADEVQTAFGRLGSCYWAFQYDDPDGVVPDIVTVGKAFGNGMPLAAVVTTSEIGDAFQAMGVEYFNTFGGNPVSCAAGLAVLDVVEDQNLQRHALEVGTHLRERFLRLKDQSSHGGIIGDVRGSGLFIGIELVRDAESAEPATAETSFICSRLKEKHHILTSIDGAHDNVLVIKPPMVFDKADADYFVDSFEEAAEELRALGDDALKSMKKTPT